MIASHHAAAAATSLLYPDSLSAKKMFDRPPERLKGPACSYGAQTPPKSTIVRMWILHNRVTLGPYITDTRAHTRHWSCTNHRKPKEPSHDSSRQYYICRLRVHVTPAVVDVGSLACLLLVNQPFMRSVFRTTDSSRLQDFV